jgi:hypothetical protein
MRLRIFYASRDCRPISQFGFNELRGTSQSFRALCVPTNGATSLGSLRNIALSLNPVLSE